MQSLDDDFSFDSSVWGAPTPVPSLLSPLHTSSPAVSYNQLDDLDDFHTPLESKTPSLAPDDDFADFGEFGEVGVSPDANFAFEEDTSFGGEAQGPEFSSLGWRSLHLDPLPSARDLSLQVEEILGPVWSIKLSSLTKDEDIRQVEGIGQLLTTSTGRELYFSLLNSPPLMEPISWIRSRIRQQHLIALGLPVNLDEMLPQTSTKSLPPLHISTRPMSAPPGARSMPQSRSNSRAGTPQPSAHPGPSTAKQLTLGPRPELSAKRTEDLLKFEIDQLNLIPLTKLDKYLADLRLQTTNASSVLTHLLQTRDALQQDSETYNRLIAELVSEAQKNKSGKGKTGVKRSGTLS